MTRASWSLLLGGPLLSLIGLLSLNAAECTPSFSALALLGLPFAGSVASPHVSCDPEPPEEEYYAESENYEQGANYGVDGEELAAGVDGEELAPGME